MGSHIHDLLLKGARVWGSGLASIGSSTLPGHLGLISAHQQTDQTPSWQPLRSDLWGYISLTASQSLSNRPVTCNTCCSAVTAWVWISGVPVLYATSIILCFHKKRFSQFLSWMTFCVNNECEMHLTCTHIQKFLQKNIWVIKDALHEVGAPHTVSAAVGTLPAERMSLKIYLKLTKRIIKQRRILKNALSSWETTSFNIMSEQILGPWREANWNKMAPPLTCIMMDWERVLTL